jgi:hypothetical protein
MSTEIDRQLLEGLRQKAPHFSAAELFEAVGALAYSVPRTATEATVEVRCVDLAYTIQMQVTEWWRYRQLCARWKDSPKDEAGAPVQPRRISCEDLACIHNALELEIAELVTMVAAAATTIDQVDAEDALTMVLRRLEQARKALTDLRGVEITTGKEVADAL